MRNEIRCEKCLRSVHEGTIIRVGDIEVTVCNICFKYIHMAIEVALYSKREREDI